VGILAHAGDGNMHPLIATDIRDPTEWKRVEAAIQEIFELSVSLGGTLSGEHGIGIAKRAFLPMVRNEATRKFMATLKAAVDPFTLLNPGKSI
jgi:glycolate oxidase